MSKRPGLAVAVLLGIVCLPAFALQVFADSNIRAVRLSYIDGDVEIDRRVDTGPERAILNLPITQGTRLRTFDGRAEVEFEEGSTVRLTPDSEVEFEILTLRSDGDRASTIAIREGTVYLNLSKKRDNDFRIVVPTQELRLRRSGRFRITVDPERVEIAAFKGELEIEKPEEVRISKHDTLVLDLRDPGRYTLTGGVQAEQYDQWNEDREEYRDRYAYAGSYRARDYHFGFADLNYYGNFHYFPGHGWLWRPYSVGLGWDPFFDGAWVWYPHVGYVFVSTHPWGWTPYRFGHWVYLSGYGWLWQPGGFRNAWSWYSFPRIRNCPTWYRIPSPPVQNAGPVVPVGGGPTTPVAGGPTRPGGRLPGERGPIRPAKGDTDPIDRGDVARGNRRNDGFNPPADVRRDTDNGREHPRRGDVEDTRHRAGGGSRRGGPDAGSLVGSSDRGHRPEPRSEPPARVAPAPRMDSPRETHAPRPEPRREMHGPRSEPPRQMHAPRSEAPRQMQAPRSEQRSFSPSRSGAGSGSGRGTNSSPSGSPRSSAPTPSRSAPRANSPR
jgi:hypothetical protein